MGRSQRVDGVGDSVAIVPGINAHFALGIHHPVLENPGIYHSRLSAISFCSQARA
jgi:hypothetical protein